LSYARKCARHLAGRRVIRSFLENRFLLSHTRIVNSAILVFCVQRRQPARTCGMRAAWYRSTIPWSVTVLGYTLYPWMPRRLHRFVPDPVFD